MFVLGAGSGDFILDLVLYARMPSARIERGILAIQIVPAVFFPHDAPSARMLSQLIDSRV